MKISIKYILLFIITISLNTSFNIEAKDMLVKYKIRKVEFQGNNSFGNKKLLATMLTRPSGLLSKVIYYPEIFEEDLKSIVSFYSRNGYLETTILEQKVMFDSLKKTVNIVIKIEEGELTKIEGISVFGNQHFDDKILTEKIQLKPGDAFNQEKIETAKLSLLMLYANNGFLDVEIMPEIKLNEENHRTIIDFIINENFQYKIGQILIEGVQKTKNKIVYRELLFKVGEIVKYSSLLSSQRNLYLTGLFQSVFIRPVPSKIDSTKKDILIEVKEIQSTEINLSGGYGSIDKLRGKIEIRNVNLSGTARKISLATKMSSINQEVETSFTEPYTLGFRWQTDMSFKYDYLDEPGYDLNRRGSLITIGRNISGRSNISLKFRHDKTKLSNVKVEKVPEKQISNVRSLTLSTIYDARDNMFNSTNGFYLEWSNELAGSFLSGTNSFVRSIGRLKFFRPIGRNYVVASGFEIGWMDVFAGSKEIPLNERFYAGGPNSLRGFAYRSIGPMDINGVEIGGQFKIIWNAVELRHSIYKMFGAAVFTDIGNVWENTQEFEFKKMRISPGIGIRVNIPLGIIRADYGFNVDKKRNEKRGMFYFNMGQAF